MQARLTTQHCTVCHMSHMAMICLYDTHKCIRIFFSAEDLSLITKKTLMTNYQTPLCQILLVSPSHMVSRGKKGKAKKGPEYIHCKKGAKNEQNRPSQKGGRRPKAAAPPFVNVAARRPPRLFSSFLGYFVH